MAILTNGGGPGTVAADACVRNGLVVPELSAETAEKLRRVIKRDIGIGNPLDLTAGVTTQEFEDTLRILAEDPGNDAIMAMYVPPAGLSIDDIEKAIDRVCPRDRGEREARRGLLRRTDGIERQGHERQQASCPTISFPKTRPGRSRARRNTA